MASSRMGHRTVTQGAKRTLLLLGDRSVCEGGGTTANRGASMDGNQRSEGFREVGSTSILGACRRRRRKGSDGSVLAGKSQLRRWPSCGTLPSFHGGNDATGSQSVMASATSSVSFLLLLWRSCMVVVMIEIRTRDYL